MNEELLVLVERHGAVGVIPPNRPEKLNALNRELVRQLAQARAALESDDAVGAIVLTGRRAAAAHHRRSQSQGTALHR